MSPTDCFVVIFTTWRIVKARHADGAFDGEGARSEGGRWNSPGTPVVYTSVQDSGVLLTIRYLCRPRLRRGTAEAMWERILDVFHEEPLPTGNALWAHPKVRLTSHTSFAGSGVRGRWDELFFANIQRFAKGQALLNEFNPKDFP